MPEDEDDGPYVGEDLEPVEARASKAHRDQRYLRFHRRQLDLGTSGLFPLAEAVRFYADERCRPNPDPSKELLKTHRDAAYQDMAKGILGRYRFTRNGKSRVLFLDPHGPVQCLTAELLRQHLDTYREHEHVVWHQIMARCWVPARLAREWMEAQGLKTSVHWPSETISPPPVSMPPALAPERAASLPTPPPSPSSSRPPRRGGLDYRKQDAELAEEIIKGVKDAKQRLLSDWAACAEVAHRAEGSDTLLSSKQKRLSRVVKQIRRERQATQAPENVSQT
jgi:hypothetical protein